MDGLQPLYSCTVCIRKEGFGLESSIHTGGKFEKKGVISSIRSVERDRDTYGNDRRLMMEKGAMDGEKVF